MDLAGYIELVEPDGRCTVLVDNWMTSVLSRNDSASLWQLDSECAECVCEASSCGVDVVEDAPWFDPSRPGARDFFGLYGSVRLAQPSSTNTVTASGTIVTAPLKQLTFVGVLAAKSARGAAFGMDWLSSRLEPLCAPCDGRTVAVQLWCPDEVCNDTPGVDTVELGVSDWCLDGINGCGEALPLGATPDPQMINDYGRRELTRVNYVSGSLVEIDDAAAPLPACHGLRVTFTFEVQSAERFLPSSGGCVMHAPTECDNLPCCTELMWNLDPVAECASCPTDCACDPLVEELPSGAVDLLADGTAECRYSTPLCSNTFACLTAPFAQENAVPTVTITAGLEDLHNVSVTIWEARPGLPNPTTAEGFEFYEQIPPVVDRALIYRVPAQSTLVLDGKEKREYLYCVGDNEPTPFPVVRCGNRRYRHPVLCCGKRYWVAFEVDCAQGGDWRVDVDVNGFERV